MRRRRSKHILPAAAWYSSFYLFVIRAFGRRAERTNDEQKEGKYRCEQPVRLTPPEGC